MGESEIARLKDQIIQNYRTAYQVLASPPRLSSQTLITAKLTSMQNDAVQLARIIGDYEAQQFLAGVMKYGHTADMPRRQEPLFQLGALIQRASGNTTLYCVTFIQYIEQTPYYHLVSREKRYLIVSHEQIHQWRKAASGDSSGHVMKGRSAGYHHESK